MNIIINNNTNIKISVISENGSTYIVYIPYIIIITAINVSPINKM